MDAVSRSKALTLSHAGTIGALFFVFFCFCLIPYTGIETDEALFAIPYFGTVAGALHLTTPNHSIPLMVFPYVGALKSILYWPVWKLFDPNPYSVRLPMVVVGAITILLFRRFAEQIADRWSAIIATALFATDPTFAITVTYDWGPVALQIFLTVVGCLSIASGWPAIGCFCFGLALWNKAIFGWAFAGLIGGAVVAYLPQLRSKLSERDVIPRCVCAFLLGALPLIAFNLQFSNGTFGSNISLGGDNLHARAVVLETTLDGSNLFGTISASGSEDAAPPRRFSGRVAVKIRDYLGTHYSDLFFFGTIGALLATPFWWASTRRRAALFAIVFSLIALVAMTLVRNTGFVHHVVLLWPMPQLFVGIAVASLRPKWLAVAIGTVLVCANLLVDNQWIVDLESKGSQGLFSDAIYPLTEALLLSSPHPVYLMDFGMSDNLNLLSRGQLNLHEGWRAFIAPDESKQTELANMVSDPEALFVGHVPGLENEPQVRPHLEAAALAAGLRKQVVRAIKDIHGRQVFEIFRFR